MMQPKINIEKNILSKAMSYLERLNSEIIKQQEIEVGYWRNEELHKKSKVDLVDIATKNEFGIGVPERPFIKQTIKDNKKNIIEKIKEIETNIVKKIITGEKASQQVGLYVVGLIKKTIQNSKSWARKNSDATIKLKKGADTPLVHYGEMMAKVNYKVKK